MARYRLKYILFTSEVIFSFENVIMVYQTGKTNDVATGTSPTCFHLSIQSSVTNEHKVSCSSVYVVRCWQANGNWVRIFFMQLDCCHPSQLKCVLWLITWKKKKKDRNLDKVWKLRLTLSNVYFFLEKKKRKEKEVICSVNCSVSQGFPPLRKKSISLVCFMSIRREIIYISSRSCTILIFF